MQKTLIRLVDDDPAVLESLAFVLEREGWTVASWTSSEAFLREDAPSAPGCLILDYSMPTMTGLELQQTMNERGYHLPIIFLTGHGDIETAVTAMKKGAVEFLEKTGDPGKLLAAVAKAVSQSENGFAVLEMPAFEARRRADFLTERELAVVKLIAAGKLNREAADRLALSVRTVENYRASAMKKLQVKGAAELAALLRAAEID